MMVGRGILTSFRVFIRPVCVHIGAEKYARLQVGVVGYVIRGVTMASEIRSKHTCTSCVLENPSNPGSGVATAD